jgi:hypothetical protein
MTFHSGICVKTSCKKIKATGSLCAEATIVVMQFAEQKEFSLPCTSVEDGDFLANPHDHGARLPSHSFWMLLLSKDPQEEEEEEDMSDERTRGTSGGSAPTKDRSE